MTKKTQTTVTDPPDDPLRLFTAWYEEAEAAEEIRYAAAMCLATADADGFPDTRIVLLEEVDGEAFIFFTDDHSRKARQLASRPEAALNFYWGPLERQVRIRGHVMPATEDVADRVFAKRPRASRITTWASRQSHPLRSRRELEERYEEAAALFRDDEEVTRPQHWQAYRLEPRSIEFWQAYARRLHHQVLYTWSAASGWEHGWLMP